MVRGNVDWVELAPQSNPVSAEPGWIAPAFGERPCAPRGARRSPDAQLLAEVHLTTTRGQETLIIEMAPPWGATVGEWRCGLAQSC